jgi:hypothetical protein
MARLEIPLSSRKLQATGDEVVRAELAMELKTNQGTWVKVRFLVDSGTEMTTMAAAEAKSLNLPIPKRPVRGLTFLGHEIRPGLLRARIVGMDSTEYTFPWDFLGDPNAPAVKLKNLLGLKGVINQIRLTFDEATSPFSPNGVLIVEKR